MTEGRRLAHLGRDDMKVFILSACFLSLSGVASPVSAAVYEWVDDKGVVSYTDNMDKIPKKYLPKVKEKEVGDSRITVRPSSPVDTVAPRAQAPTVNPLSAGAKRRWTARYSSLREEKKALELGLVAKKEMLNTLRRKKVIYQRGRDRSAYNAQQEEIERDQARIQELEQRLAELDTEAARAGVPLEWRQ